LNLYKDSDLCIIANLTTIEVNKIVNLDIFTEFDIRCDRLELHSAPPSRIAYSEYNYFQPLVIMKPFPLFLNFLVNIFRP